MSERPMLIAGGGIAGLSLALALGKIGRRSRVLERRAEFSEAGAGIQIGPNGVRALQVLGVRGPVEAMAGRPSEITVYEGRSGSVLQHLPLGDWINERHGAPYLVAHRRDLQAALLAGVARETRIEVTTGFEAEAFEAVSGGVRVRSTTGTIAEGAGLVCADGVHSRLRRALYPGRPPVFTGRTASRTVLPAERVQGLLDTGVTGVWLAPDAHAVHYPVRSGHEVAVVVVQTGAWQEPGWSAPVTYPELDAALSGYARRLRQALAVGSEWRRWALFDAEPLSTWSKGPVTLIGDAAHPVLPFLAQGGCLALEDALTLAACVDRAGEDLAGAFRAYERERIPRSAQVVRGARRNGRVYHLRGLGAKARDTALGLMSPDRIMAGYDWLYGWQPPPFEERVAS